MATDQGPVVQSALLRLELVRMRRDKDLTQEQVAADLEWSPSKLIRVEGGRSSITKVDLDALMNRYGVTSEVQRDRMQALNRGARERGWWDDYRDQLAPAYVNYVGYEAGASFIRNFQALVVPGLLQTSGYAQELAGSTVEDKIRIASAVKLRLLRQAELAKRTPQPRQYFVLDEAVIRRHVGIHADPGIMPEQLRQIAARAHDDERVTVRVIPFSVGAHAGHTGPFTLLEFDGGLPDILYLDAGRDQISMVSGDDGRIGEYADAFEKLLGSALSAGESIEFILAAAEEMS
ncbi:MAG TPA: helix-turn-helix transcriptional regulator [Streptosporangiaceae bacterium]|nr:helix-turn-helix transcriptional regulator [Streptosporangiaceae bacterium]